MATFHATSTGEEVVKALADQVKGRIFVITGANAVGLGGKLAVTLAAGSPAQIIIVSRTAKNAEPVLASIAAANPAVKTKFVSCDLTDRDSIRQAVATITEIAPKIDVLINNAGIMAVQEYTTDKHGVELQLSANYLGHFLLSNLLMPNLIAAGSARVVNVSSQGYRCAPFNFDDPNFSGGKTYEMWTAYGASKTANILFAFALTKRTKHLGVTSTAVHPGFIMGTNLGTHLDASAFEPIAAVTLKNTGKEWYWDMPQSKTIEQGASTPLVAALHPKIAEQSPAYIANAAVEKPYDYADDAELAEKLWELSEQLIGQKFEY